METRESTDTQTTPEEDLMSKDDSENQAPTEPPSMFSTSMAPPSVTQAPSRTESQTNPDVAAVTVDFEKDDSLMTEFNINEFDPKITESEAQARGDVVRIVSTADPTVTETPYEESEDLSLIKVSTIPPDVPLPASPSTEPMFAVGKTEESVVEKITAYSVSNPEEMPTTPYILDATKMISGSPDAEGDPMSSTDETTGATKPTAETSSHMISTYVSSRTEPTTKQSGLHSSPQMPVHLISESSSRRTMETDDGGFPGTAEVHKATGTEITPTEGTPITILADYDVDEKEGGTGVMAGPPSIPTEKPEAEVPGLDTTDVTTEATVTFTTVVCDTVPDSETDVSTPGAEEVKSSISSVDDSSLPSIDTKPSDIIVSQETISTTPPSDVTTSTVSTDSMPVRLTAAVVSERTSDESTSAVILEESSAGSPDSLSETEATSSDTDAKHVQLATVSPTTSPTNCTVSPDGMSVHVIIINVEEQNPKVTDTADIDSILGEFPVIPEPNDLPVPSTVDGEPILSSEDSTRDFSTPGFTTKPELSFINGKTEVSLEPKYDVQKEARGDVFESASPLVRNLTQLEEKELETTSQFDYSLIDSDTTQDDSLVSTQDAKSSVPVFINTIEPNYDYGQEGIVVESTPPSDLVSDPELETLIHEGTIVPSTPLETERSSSLKPHQPLNESETFVVTSVEQNVTLLSSTAAPATKVATEDPNQVDTSVSDASMVPPTAISATVTSKTTEYVVSTATLKEGPADVSISTDSPTMQTVLDETTLLTSIPSENQTLDESKIPDHSELTTSTEKTPVGSSSDMTVTISAQESDISYQTSSSESSGPTVFNVSQTAPAKFPYTTGEDIKVTSTTSAGMTDVTNVSDSTESKTVMMSEDEGSGDAQTPDFLSTKSTSLHTTPMSRSDSIASGSTVLSKVPFTETISLHDKSTETLTSVAVPSSTLTTEEMHKVSGTGSDSVFTFSDADGSRDHTQDSSTVSVDESVNTTVTHRLQTGDGKTSVHSEETSTLDKSMVPTTSVKAIAKTQSEVSTERVTPSAVKSSMEETFMSATTEQAPSSVHTITTATPALTGTETAGVKTTGVPTLEPSSSVHTSHQALGMSTLPPSDIARSYTSKEATMEAVQTGGTSEYAVREATVAPIFATSDDVSAVQTSDMSTTVPSAVSYTTATSKPNMTSYKPEVTDTTTHHTEATSVRSKPSRVPIIDASEKMFSTDTTDEKTADTFTMESIGTVSTMFSTGETVSQVMTLSTNPGSLFLFPEVESTDDQIAETLTTTTTAFTSFHAEDQEKVTSTAAILNATVLPQSESTTLDMTSVKKLTVTSVHELSTDQEATTAPGIMNTTQTLTLSQAMSMTDETTVKSTTDHYREAESEKTLLTTTSADITSSLLFSTTEEEYSGDKLIDFAQEESTQTTEQDITRPHTAATDGKATAKVTSGDTLTVPMSTAETIHNATESHRQMDISHASTVSVKPVHATVESISDSERTLLERASVTESLSASQTPHLTPSPEEEFSGEKEIDLFSTATVTRRPSTYTATAKSVMYGHNMTAPMSSYTTVESPRSGPTTTETTETLNTTAESHKPSNMTEKPTDISHTSTVSKEPFNFTVPSVSDSQTVLLERTSVKEPTSASITSSILPSTEDEFSGEKDIELSSTVTQGKITLTTTTTSVTPDYTTTASSSSHTSVDSHRSNPTTTEAAKTLHTTAESHSASYMTEKTADLSHTSTVSVKLLHSTVESERALLERTSVKEPVSSSITSSMLPSTEDEFSGEKDIELSSTVTQGKITLTTTTASVTPDYTTTASSSSHTSTDSHRSSPTTTEAAKTLHTTVESHRASYMTEKTADLSNTSTVPVKPLHSTVESVSDSERALLERTSVKEPVSSSITSSMLSSTEDDFSGENDMDLPSSASVTQGQITFTAATTIISDHTTAASSTSHTSAESHRPSPTTTETAETLTTASSYRPIETTHTSPVYFRQFHTTGESVSDSETTLLDKTSVKEPSSATVTSSLPSTEDEFSVNQQKNQGVLEKKMMMVLVIYPVQVLLSQLLPLKLH
ncbi:serine-rich adhesin for platelets-like [Hoplias malabaricus]|uniref:serine-rich adhesin for platelets-like n=1 Tax=Hoplias malabaricus TaxID=27720 RepID=UPI0034633AB3